MEAMLIRLDAGGRTGATVYAPGRRLFAYCIAGGAVLVLDEPPEQLAVEPGDSVVLEGPRTIAWENRGASVAELITVTARLV
jgi:hypothetical protein